MPTFRPLAAIVVLALPAALAAAGCRAEPQGSEPVASAASALIIPGLFSTGVDGTGTPLPVGAVDPHYVLTSNDAAFPGPSALTVTPAGGWSASTATSKWISIQASTTGATNDTYTYTTTFTLAGVNPASATITGKWSCDDTCVLRLNGTQVAADPSPAWGAVAAFTVPAGSPFVVGVNTLAFVTTNTTGGPTGLQVVSMTGNVAGCTADNQCTAAQFCNTASATCVPKLADGTPVPVVAGHTPPLTGACNAAAGAAVCVAGVCDTKDNDCGYANGDGPCTAGNGPTVCRSGACSSNGTCEPAGGCNVDADCTGGKWCNESTHTCTPKLANGSAMPSDPAHASPVLNAVCTDAAATLVCVSGVCDVADNRCGYANGDGPCTMGSGPTVCRSGACSSNGTCEAAGGCNVDGDCAPDQYCDTPTYTCTPKVPNGDPVPTVPGHAPTLDGTCNTMSGADACLSGVCDPKDNDCGYANGDGPCTPADGPVVCRSTVCASTGPSQGHCVACTVDSQCPGATPVCDQATNTCVQCTAASGCSGATPVCDPASSMCVPCNGDQGSGATHACSGAGSPFCFLTGPDQGQCGKCTTDSDCQGHPSGNTCDTAAGTCHNGSSSGCTTDADCSASQFCQSGTCTTKLPTGATCTQGDQCLSGDCAGGTCSAVVGSGNGLICAARAGGDGDGAGWLGLALAASALVRRRRRREA